MLLRLFLFFWITCSHAQYQTMREGETPPLFELGGGAFWSQIPDYPGARYSKKIFIPFPAGLYRGERLRADEEGGMRSRFFYSDTYELNLSVGGSLPGKSKDNPDREGMPGLDTVLEFGPGLIFHFLKPKWGDRFKLSVNIPTRIAFSFDSDSLVQRGFVFNPMLYMIYDRIFSSRLSIFSSIDMRFSTSKNQDFYYGVGPLQARDFRPQYAADGGYMGSGFSFGINYNYQNRLTFFTGGYYSNYKGTANEKSYLLRDSETLSIGVGLIWWFYHSDVKGVAI